LTCPHVDVNFASVRIAEEVLSDMAQQTGYVTLTLKFQREGNNWVGTCVELGTSTFDKTLEGVQKELLEMVVAHLNALEQEGERARFFEEWGIVFKETRPAKPSEFLIRDPLSDWPQITPFGPFFQPVSVPVEREEKQIQLFAGI
jgi:hypothetical protein